MTSTNLQVTVGCICQLCVSYYHTNGLLVGSEIKTTERAVCAFAAGYLIKILQEREICYLCIANLEHTGSSVDSSVKYDHVLTSSLGNAVPLVVLLQLLTISFEKIEEV